MLTVAAPTCKAGFGDWPIDWIAERQNNKMKQALYTENNKFIIQYLRLEVNKGNNLNFFLTKFLAYGFLFAPEFCHDVADMRQTV
jgi:hypothetical protein